MELPKDYLEESFDSKGRVTRQRFTRAIACFVQSGQWVIDYSDAKKFGVSRTSYYRYHQFLMNRGGFVIYCGTRVNAVISDGKCLFTFGGD